MISARFNQSTKGFTLMELIGVMAIISIMAGIIAPSVFDTITRAYGDAEEQNVKNIADSLVRYINDTKRIPSQNVNNWTSAVAAYSDMPQAKIEFNARNFRRRVYIDPRFFTSTDTTFAAYTQTTGLTQTPVSPRIMVVSDLTGNAPNPPNTNAAFSDIWDQTVSSPIVESSKVKIYRLHMGKYFHRLLLVNSKTQQSAYNFESGAVAAVPAGTGTVDGTLTLYVLNNSRLGLYADPFPAGSLLTVSTLNSETGYHYKTDGATWFWEQL